MSDKVYLGLKTGALETAETLSKISRINLSTDSGNMYTSGTDDGRTTEVSIPWGTQAMADHILAGIKDITYRPYTAEQALLDPAAEIGDAITVGGIYSAIYQTSITFDRQMTATVSAPTSDETEDEYPYQSKSRRKASRQLAQTRSMITKTAEQIRLEVTNEVEGLSSSFTVELDSISAEIESMDGRLTSLDMGLDGISAKVTDNTNSIAALDLYVDSLTLSVSNGSTSSTISLKAGSTTISSQNIAMSGLVTYTGLADGTTTINGGCIQTGLIDAERLNLTGAISFSDLSSSVQNDINDAYTMAEDAQTVANGVDGIISDWSYVYRGKTYIDGGMLMTGTVKASELLGGSVGLLTSAERTAGGIEITGSSFSTYAIELYSGGELLLTGGSNAIMQCDAMDSYVEVADYITLGGGEVRSNVDGGFYLGTATRRWNAVFAATSVIQTSDRNKKHDIQDLPDKYLQMLLMIPPKIFKMDDGTSDRFHVGYVAQDVEEVMGQIGIDSLEFAGFVKDKDEDGNDIYMLRYDEFMAIHTMAIQKIYQRLEAAGL